MHIQYYILTEFLLFTMQRRTYTLEDRNRIINLVTQRKRLLKYFIILIICCSMIAVFIIWLDKKDDTNSNFNLDFTTSSSSTKIFTQSVLSFDGKFPEVVQIGEITYKLTAELVTVSYSKNLTFDQNFIS